MTQALTVDGHDLARDLYALLRELHTLLRDLDPARWRDELEQAFRQRLSGISAGVRQIRDALEPSDRLDPVRAKLGELSTLIDDNTPGADLPAGRMRREWNALRKRLLDTYEALAQLLRPYDIHVPNLRPTNYTRNIFHVGTGLFATWLVLSVLTPISTLVVGLSFAALAWSMELSRRRSGRVNDALMVLFGKVAHPHEAHRINSSTWYATAVGILALTASPLTTGMALLVLGVGDPCAALVGRRYGRTKLVNGRSLEGTLAFAISGTLAGVAMLAIFFPELSLGASVLLALGGAITGAIVELYSRRVDDNLSIPVTVAAGTGVVLFFLGLG